MWEEWVAHPDKRAYVHTGDRWSYAIKPGWWASGSTFDDAALEAQRLQPEARLPSPIKGPPAKPAIAPLGGGEVA